MTWDQLKPRLAPAAVIAIVTIIGGITAAISYAHEAELAGHNGQSWWIARLVPFAVDGMVVAASIALLWAAWQGISNWKRLLRPRIWLAVGISATIAANLFSDLRFWWLGPAVSASCGIAVVIISDIAFWMLGEHRRLTSGEDPQLAANCHCPAPAVSVAEALPRARAELIARGAPHGQEVLADRFGITVHQVRKILAPQPVPSVNGSGGPGGA